MANFSLNDINSDFNKYKNKRNSALTKLKEKRVKFAYSNKFKFPDKSTALPIFVFEASKVDKEIVKLIKERNEGTVAEGSCYKNADGVLVFNVAKGKLKDFRMVTPWQEGEAIATNTQVGGSEISVEDSKLDSFDDLYARQKRKLKKANDDAAAIQSKFDAAVKDYTEALKKSRADKKNVDLGEAKTAATLAKTAAQKARNANLALIKFLSALVTKIESASTPADKARILFDEGKFDTGIKQLEGAAYKSMMATDEAIMVLGRTADTWALQLPDDAKGRTLVVDPDKYSLPANDAFMKSGLDIKAQFQLVSPLNEMTKRLLKMKSLNRGKFDTYVENAKEKEPALWNKRGNCPAVSAREIGQLIADGYWFAEHPDPKNSSKLVQMMFPRSASQELQEELAAYVKGGK